MVPAPTTLAEWESIAVIIASLMAMAPIYNYAIRPMFRFLRSQAKAVMLLPELADSMRQIRNELTTNGGSSLKDAVVRIERRQAENTQMIQAMFHHGSFKADTNGSIIDVSKAMCKLFRRSNSELMGNAWITWVAEDDRDDVEREWNKAILGKRDFDEHFSIRMDDRTEVKVHLRADQLLDPKGVCTGYFGVFSLA